MIDVAVDARWAQGPRVGGIGRGLLSLMPRLSALGRVVALTDPRRGDLECDVPTRSARLPFPAPSLVWLDVCAPAALRRFEGVFHSPFYFLPLLTPRPAVVTLHDVSFETHRHLFTGLRGRSFRLRGRLAARSAERIVAVSQWGREQILDVYGVPEETVAVVPNGVEGTFQPLMPAEIETLRSTLAGFGVRSPYVMAIGGADRRRSDIAIEAWRRMRKRALPHDLVVVGEDGPSADGLRFLPYVQSELYRTLLGGAELLLYPTEMEGFGMPALEAAACGTPSVCSPVAALPEVLGEAAVWCEHDPDSYADGSAALLHDRFRLDSLSEAVIARARRFDWDTAARALAQVYDDAWANRRSAR